MLWTLGSVSLSSGCPFVLPRWLLQGVTRSLLEVHKKLGVDKRWLGWVKRWRPWGGDAKTGIFGGMRGKDGVNQMGAVLPVGSISEMLLVRRQSWQGYWNGIGNSVFLTLSIFSLFSLSATSPEVFYLSLVAFFSFFNKYFLCADDTN